MLGAHWCHGGFRFPVHTFNRTLFMSVMRIRYVNMKGGRAKTGERWNTGAEGREVRGVIICKGT